MKEERRLTEWLADYRDSLDPVATPLRVEARLRTEMRRRRRIPVAPWLLALSAAAVLLLGIWIGRSRPSLVSPDVKSARIPAEAPVTELVPAVELAVPTRRLPVIRRRLMPAPVDTSRPMAVFVMLPGTDLMPPAQDLQVLRVRIPRTRMQALGWPVNVDRLEERVLADIVVGEDGVARAIRLVQVSQ